MAFFTSGCALINCLIITKCTINVLYGIHITLTYTNVSPFVYICLVYDSLDHNDISHHMLLCIILCVYVHNLLCQILIYGTCIYMCCIIWVGVYCYGV